MSKLKKLMKRFLPREFFSEYQAVVLSRGRRGEVNKYFRGGPDRYEFEFTLKHDSVFVVKIGKAFGREGRFQGVPTDFMPLQGRELPQVLALSGRRYGLQPGDTWLVKVRIQTFDESTRENVLDIYVTKAEAD